MHKQKMVRKVISTKSAEKKTVEADAEETVEGPVAENRELDVASAIPTFNPHNPGPDPEDEDEDEDEDDLEERAKAPGSGEYVVPFKQRRMYFGR